MRKIVVTGCGRSGTGSLAEALTAAGVPCGHEEVFGVNGPVDWGNLQADASWFAAGMTLPADVGIIHVVRNPLAVAASLYRIGLFETPPWRLVLGGRLSIRKAGGLLVRPARCKRRIRNVRWQRGLVDQHTSVFTERDETVRCLRYWEEWDSLTARLNDGHRPYLRVRLEDEPWRDIGAFLGVELAPVKANHKPAYPPRPLPDVEIPTPVAERAAQYGYELPRRYR